MGYVLEELECEAKLVAGESDALATLTHWQPQVVLADYRLGEHANGLDLITRIREDVDGLPAYLITGDVNASQVQAAKAMDTTILHKPVSLADLRTALMQVVGS